MNLDRYIDDLRAQMAAAADTGDADTRAIAERLNASLGAVARLVLLEALSDAASEITRQIAPGSVDIRLRGRDPEFVVSRPAAPEFDDTKVTPTSTSGSREPVVEEPLDDAVTTRTTLRLPDQLKSRVERAAAEDQLSVNSWLVRAIAAAVEPRNRRTTRRETRSGDSFTGWAR